MGVHGLWQLIEPSGKPVPLETLESKVLAVDISIWLHQAVKGFQDSKGAPVPHAHLLGIYHRVCKLLYFKVKPVFIFDGGVPVLKKQTIAKRNQLKSRNISEAERLQKQLLSTLLKHSAISKILSEKTKASLTSALPKKTNKHENMYVLPHTELDSTVSSSEDDDTEDTDSSPGKHWDLHTIDMSSTYFKSLPVDVKHEILTDLKETRKQNSWGRLHELPKQSDEFSGYQMKRLLKRQAVQSALEDAEKEMGGHSLSLVELESILKDHGVVTTNDVGKRIASDENTRYLYIKDVKQALDKARMEQQRLEVLQQSDDTGQENKVDKEAKEPIVQLRDKADQEFEDDLQKAITLSLQEEPSTSKLGISKSICNKEKIEFSFLENFNDADFQSDSSEDFEEVCPKKTFSSAQNYMIEYSGLTPNEIAKIMDNKTKQSLKKSREKRCGKEILGLKVIDVSDSEVSNEYIEVSVEDDKPKDNVMSFPVKYTGKTTSTTMVSKEKSKEQTDLSTEESQVLSNSNKLLTTQESIESKEKQISSSNLLFSNNEKNKVTDTSEAFIKEALSTDKKDSHGLIQYNTIKTYADSTKLPNIESAAFKIKQSYVDGDKLVGNYVKDNSSNKDEENVDNIEIMSDSGESNSSLEFIEISKSKECKNSMEIKIDLNQSLDEENDLFSDIFSKNEKTQRPHIIIDPQSKLEGNMFSDVFKDKSVLKMNKSDTNKVHITNTDDMSVDVTGKQIEIVNKAGLIKQIEEVKGSTDTSSVIMDFKKGENIEVERNVKEIKKLKLSVDEMQDLKNNLQREKIDLMVEKATRERMATNITDQMYQEAQELLELFGMPYIVAPMEAEAQCAFLDAIELTDGTITDDSDIWLFGGRTVYKNFFNQSKYVMEFKAENIKHHFKLTREQMILLALLVGSDYTTGIQGIGPVTAMEILAAFPPSRAKEFTLSHAELLSGLKEFQSWINKGRTAGPGRSALKSKLKNILITDAFPSLQVVQAYMEPTVDTSREKFSWSKPDFEGLTDFARIKFGWSTRKTEEILKPVIKRMEEKRMQTTIKNFFKSTNKILSQEAKDKMSKRVKSAIDRIGKTPEELIAEEMETLSKAQQKKRGKRQPKTESKTTSRKKTSCTEANEESVPSNNVEVKTRQTRSRKKRSDESVAILTNKIVDNPISELKKPRRNKSVLKENKYSDAAEVTAGISLEQDQDNEENELHKYENIAKELKKRRQKKNEMAKKEETIVKKKQILVKKSLEIHPEDLKEAQKCNLQTSNLPENVNKEVNKLKLHQNMGLNTRTKNNGCEGKDENKKSQTVEAFVEAIPRGLEGDEEIRLFQATTSRSIKRVEEIDQEIKNELDRETKKKCLPNFHKKEIIHQKLRDRSNLLRNKLKAIEVFRKSKKGPGYVEKRKKKVTLPKDDAELSENSSSD